MAIRVALNHQTSYQFDRLVSASPHVIRLRPAPHTRTPVRAYSLNIQPSKHFINWLQDPFGNYQARLVFPEKIHELIVAVDLIADMTIINPFDFFVESYAEKYGFKYEPGLHKELTPYLEIKEQGPQLLNWLAEVDRSPVRTVDFLVELNARMQKDVEYLIRMEPGVQTCEETLTKRSGSCRDSAWLLVQILRHLGLASRFVSGYLIQLTPDMKSLDGPSGTTYDFTDLHAWAEVFLPGAGWIGLDPTSGLLASEGHIPLACTPNPNSASPVTGATDVCEVEFDFAMSVSRIHEDPRVTKPYTEAQWSRIEALGHAVDQRLQDNDVRLTMGGEPTFVSIDDMDGAEWTIAAQGPTKRKLAGRLLKRLRRQFAPNGFLHYGQGKWYPGESLPRWALSCYWRTDGLPLWHDPRLLADDEINQGYGPDDAKRFITALTRRLGVHSKWALPGYEDAYYYLWKERTLPVNVDPREHDLDDDEERLRLARILEQGLGKVVGYALPLRWQETSNDGHWRSGPWVLRRDHLYLIPGDSPMGYRLPLASLPWVDEVHRELPHEQSLFEFRAVLGDSHGEVMHRYSKWLEANAPRADFQEQPLSDDADTIHTAFCAEARDGHLYLFMPPLGKLEHYLDLLASIEHTAAELDMPVLIEGYTPPSDWRLNRFIVTPDPGVIEVNIHPAYSWDELTRNTHILYDEARQSRLGTEKFMLDGRHTGTGGGNHVTLGAATPTDSPFLRRPDLLRSMVTYWQHHPSLSYLFSGLFVGPTSQAPRVDEARNESLYELEIAFKEMPPGETPQPWLVDRLLRNLLIDLTGNTHRAEFCIDKLYSPDSASGRLGLVEMRAFEMPPHERMSLMQMLLLRSLVARFWEQPYQHKLVRWGTRIHDQFLLPHYVWQDFKDVIDDLNRADFPLALDWFDPFFEFRFPHYGDVIYQGVQLELRQAIEPWNVLGEEMVLGGTARYVDSSVERLQLKATDLVEGRHAVTCNGRRVPLHPTGVPGEFVAGIRYRAWQPPSALHPTIAVHAPLVFDIVDTWNGRSIGGCTYHVEHPGGLNPSTFPVNAYEAEGRRLARFWNYGHTPGPMEPPPEDINPDYPHTLDLRRR